MPCASKASRSCFSSMAELTPASAPSARELHVSVDHLFEGRRDEEPGVGHRLRRVAGRGDGKVALLGVKLRPDDGPRTVLRPERFGHSVAPARAARVRENAVARSGGDHVGRAKGARGEELEALERPAREERVGPDRVGVELGERLRGRAAEWSREVQEERVVRRELNLRARGVRIGRPGSLDVGRGGEAADPATARAPQHVIDEAKVVLGSPVAAPRLEQRQELSAPAEPKERRDAVSHGGRELAHPSGARVAERVPVPALGVERVGPRLGSVVPVVGAAEDRDRRRAALREQLRVQEGVVALDRLEGLTRFVARRGVERLAVRAERARVAIVPPEGREKPRESALQELGVVRVVAHLSAGREVRLAGGVRVHAEDPRGGEDRAPIVGPVRRDLAHDRRGARGREAVGARGSVHDQAQRPDRAAFRQRDQPAAQGKDRPVGAILPLRRRLVTLPEGRAIRSLRLVMNGATGADGLPAAGATPVVREIAAYRADDRRPILAAPWILSVNANPSGESHLTPGGEMCNDAYHAKFLQSRFARLLPALGRDDRYARSLGPHGEALDAPPSDEAGEALESIEGDDPFLDAQLLSQSSPPPIAVLSGSNDWDYAPETGPDPLHPKRWYWDPLRDI